MRLFSHLLCRVSLHRHIYPGFGGLIYDVRFESSDNSQLRATFPFPSADEWCILINNEINKVRINEDE